MGPKILYFSVLSLLMGAQILVSLENRNFWPISSFNVFANSVSGDAWVVRVVLSNEEGEQQVVDPGAVLPVEFFRARAMMLEGFSPSRPIEKRDEFARAILYRLKYDRWSEFDEVYAPASMNAPTKLNVQYWRVTPSRQSNRVSLQPLERVLIYSGPHRSE